MPIAGGPTTVLWDEGTNGPTGVPLSDSASYFRDGDKIYRLTRS